MVYLYLDPLFSLLIVHAPVVTDNVPVVDAACSISISADSVPAQTVTIAVLLFERFRPTEICNSLLPVPDVLSKVTQEAFFVTTLQSELV